MRLLLITIVSLLVACNNLSEQGFTDKAEAKNEMVNGLKEGKWIEYNSVIDGRDTVKTDSSRASYFKLTVYRIGKPFGLVRTYYKDGILMKETPYIDGEKNGIEKRYYKDGKLKCMLPYSMGKLNGTVKGFFENGMTDLINPYVNGKENGMAKSYYESGKLMSEITSTNGVITKAVYYDENGNQIK